MGSRVAVDAERVSALTAPESPPQAEPAGRAWWVRLWTLQLLPAALFLSLRGRIGADATPAGAPRRPERDRAVLADIAARLEELL